MFQKSQDQEFGGSSVFPSNNSSFRPHGQTDNPMNANNGPRFPFPRGNQSWFSDEIYTPVQAGSIDGTDTVPHDHGIVRASKAVYDPDKDRRIKGDPYKTLFVGRLSWNTSEETLRKEFSKFGRLTHVRLVRDIVTGHSKGYGFVTYESSRDFSEAFRATNHMTIDERQILVDFERERILKGWIPRRFGGGLGGRKESGQLRFGGRDRPFKKPLMQPVPANEFKRFDERRGIDKFAGRKYRNKYDKEETEDHDRKRERERSPGSERRSKRTRSRSRERDYHKHGDSKERESKEHRHHRHHHHSNEKEPKEKPKERERDRV